MRRLPRVVAEAMARSCFSSSTRSRCGVQVAALARKPTTMRSGPRRVSRGEVRRQAIADG